MDVVRTTSNNIEVIVIEHMLQSFWGCAALQQEGAAFRDFEKCG